MDLVRSLFILGICFSGWTPVAASDKTDGSDLDNGTNNCRTESPCPDNTVCSSWQKDHYCTCKPGFKTRSGNITFTDIKESCDDINECIPPTLVDCGLNAECKNTIGSYHCICLQGYQTKSGEKEFKNKTETTCEDVDECKILNACPKNSFCTNTIGSYYCQCKEGFWATSGNTFTKGAAQCEDVDKCKNSNTCPDNSTCVNTGGSYHCECNNGYQSTSGNKTIINKTDRCLARNKCTKINGTNFCACDKGYIYSEKVLQRSNEKPTCLRVRCHSSNHSQQETCNSTNDNFIFCLKKFINSSVPNCSSLGKQPKQGEKLLQDILNNVDKQFSQAKWNSNQLQKHQQASEFLQLMEETAKDFMWLLEDGTTDIKSVSRMSIWKGNNSLQSPINLNQNETRMDLDWETAAGPENSGVAVMGLLTLKDMKTVLSNASLKDWNGLADSREEAEMRVISNVVTAFVSSEDTKNLRSPVNFTFSHQDVEKKEIICAFWNYSENRWSQDGCCKLQRTATETMCTCSHLSSFAVLMAHYTIEDWRLTVITQVGLVISLLCLLFSIITFMFCRILQGTRNTIHLHLCISLFLAYTIFLTGISRTNNQTACSVVAGFLHFFFLASFCWMCLEGVELYRMVVQVFKTHTLKKRYMFLAGYGIPALIVTISAAVNSKGYGTNNYCWLSLEGGFNWSFLAPVCLIVLINAAIFVITVWKLAQKFSTINPDIEKLKKIRTFTITAIAQLCILGLTWIFGIFQFSRHTLVMSYIFTILNCFQGLFIFLLHCLLKKQVREQYHRWFCAVFRLKEPDKYSPFTSSAAPFSSASQSRGNQSSKESGL
ncbi:adhesion G protein-coupled receptor E5 isoform X6 [Microcaecilia unicolor]|uniref:CD97 antigen isoform X6 n=1 Tax=Microcaecilia unicolor TaxID=1415580 RepID=A0A6P7XRD9_9AMPH|nr:CD97 antigen isoform X6 [Microcaecilia unicolor]